MMNDTLVGNNDESSFSDANQMLNPGPNYINSTKDSRNINRMSRFTKSHKHKLWSIRHMMRGKILARKRALKQITKY